MCNDNEKQNSTILESNTIELLELLELLELPGLYEKINYIFQKNDNSEKTCEILNKYLKI